MAEEIIGGTKLKENFGDFLAVGPVSTQGVLLYPPHKVYAMTERTMTQTNMQKRRGQRKNPLSSASIPIISSILLTKRYRNYLFLIGKGRRLVNAKKEPYHFVLLRRSNVKKTSPLELKGKLSSYLIITVEPLCDFYDKIQRHFKSSDQLEKRREAIK